MDSTAHGGNNTACAEVAATLFVDYPGEFFVIFRADRSIAFFCACFLVFDTRDTSDFDKGVQCGGSVSKYRILITVGSGVYSETHLVCVSPVCDQEGSNHGYKVPWM